MRAIEALAFGMPFLTCKVTLFPPLFLPFFSLISAVLLFPSGKICDGSNGDVAVDQYHRYLVRS